ncbi:MAG: hypothetical protein HRT72_05230 [Flavobacteriales bacterium]|nr:hypothetical protein [Flavobacteriales bacterium]
MRLLLIATISFQLLISLMSFGQNGPTNYPFLISQKIDNQLNNVDVEFHSSIKPYTHTHLSEYVKIDSLIENLSIGTGSSIMKMLMLKHVLEKKTERYKFSVDPIITTQAGYGKNILSTLSTGLAVKLDIGEKWRFGGTYASSLDRLPQTNRNFALENRVIPNSGFASPLDSKKKDSISFGSRYWEGFAAYSPSKHFDISVGNGKNFIGDGYRSLFLSDFSNSYPYVKVLTKFWKINYVNLFMNFKDISNGTNYFNSKNKYASVHYLSWNISKRVNLGIFEAVVFESRDSTKMMGFDINYINPIIFFRPVEYSLGSADNVMMGWSLKIKIFKKQQIYFQMIIDEFLKNQMVQRTKWWANKYGLQFGFKSFDVFKINGLDMQIEYNLVRPFTYSHNAVSQNYGHFNQPLAHPFGANFMEGIGIINYNAKRWNINSKVVYAYYGLDAASDSLSYGKDIFISNKLRVKKQRNVIGQGVLEHLLVSELSLTYLVNSYSNLTLELKFVNRNAMSSIKNGSTNFIMFGIRTNVLKRYFDI